MRPKSHNGISGSEGAIPGIAQSRNDVTLFIQALIDSPNKQWNIRMGICKRRETLRSSEN